MIILRKYQKQLLQEKNFGKLRQAFYKPAGVFFVLKIDNNKRIVYDY